MGPSLSCQKELHPPDQVQQLIQQLMPSSRRTKLRSFAKLMSETQEGIHNFFRINFYSMI